MEKKDKKLSKIFAGFLLALKFIFGIIALAIIILIIDFFAGDNTWQTVVTEIHKGCYIECLDNNKQSIYYCPDGDETKKKYIVEEWGSVIGYASDGKDIVAVHCFCNKSEEAEEEIFFIFNTEKEEKISFVSQEKLLDFCKKEEIVLLSWQSAHCKSFQLKED